VGVREILGHQEWADLADPDGVGVKCRMAQESFASRNRAVRWLSTQLCAELGWGRIVNKAVCGTQVPSHMLDARVQWTPSS